MESERERGREGEGAKVMKAGGVEREVADTVAMLPLLGDNASRGSVFV